MRLAIGLTVHTGWAAGVVAGGSLDRPHVAARAELELLDDDERFVYHRAAELAPAEAAASIARARTKAIAAARRALAAVMSADVIAAAVVARPGPPGELAHILAAHPRIHTAEGCFYRDVLLEALDLPVKVIAPSTLDAAAPSVTALASTVGRPWGKDQKLAALAAWSVLART